MIRLAPPQCTEAELQAFERCCERLAGFAPHLSLEHVDGFLTALASGPNAPPTEVWLAALADDAFERAFGDPEDQTQALAALQARLRVLVRQLDPEAMFDQPEAMRLDPVILEWTEDDRERARQDGADEFEVANLQIGGAWGNGFMSAVENLPAWWPEPPDESGHQAIQQALDQINALTLPADSDEMRAHLAAFWPAATPPEPTRDELITEACFSVQDLRMYCVDFAPVAATRRVEATPGRNDPCPCGSGKKFKKCHGAAA